jgi:hypothetical protein
MTGYTFSQLFDFTRTTAGTFVGSNGLIQNTPASRNILTFTQEFDNAAWTKNNSTITANTAIAPDGTATADKLAETAVTSSFSAVQAPTLAFSTTYTFSCYMKAAERTFGVLNIFTGAASCWTWFNLSTGVVSTLGAGATATIAAVGNGWYRCTLTIATAASGSPNIAIFPAATNGALSYAGTAGSGIFLWGAQLEVGSAATEYTRNNGGLFPARFDYDPVTLAPRGILIEEQRTNLLLRSAEFDNASWDKQVGATITATNVIAPDGTATAETLTLLAGSECQQSATIVANATYASSVWVKRSASGSATAVRLSSNNSLAWNTGGSTKITLTNTWQRVVLAGTISGGATTWRTVIGTKVENGSNDPDCIGNVDIWGAQLEAGAFPTSYIPTVASQVTRSADICNITAPMFTPWYNTNEGTFVVEADTSFVGNFPVVVGYSAASTASFLYVTSGGKIGTWNGTNALDAVAGATTTNNAVFKAANAYAASSRNISMNGAAVASDANAVGSASFIALGKPGLNTSQMLNGHIRSIRYYPFRASNNQLQALTT